MLLSEEAHRVAQEAPADLINRAVQFLSVGDSRASFAIEGEEPPSGQLHRWAVAISEAGNVVLTLSELERLQHLVLGASGFTQMGIRKEGGFIGRPNGIQSIFQVTVEHTNGIAYPNEGHRYGKRLGNSNAKYIASTT